jgi:hypothetical protein
MREKFLVVGLTAVFLFAGCIDEPVAPANDPPITESVMLWHPDVEALHTRIHEALAADETIVLSAKEIVNINAIGTGVGAERDFEVVLVPSTVLTNMTWAEIDGETVEMPFFEAYDGHVVGRTDWPVRLTLTESWARAYILATGGAAGSDIQPMPHILRIGLDGNLPPIEDDDDDANATSKRVVHPPTRFDHPDWPEQDCLELVPPHLTPVTQRPSDLSTITARIILDGDAQYMDALGEHAFPMMVAFLQETDAIYERETSIRLEIVGLHMHTNESYFPDPGDSSPFNALAGYWNERLDIERDIVHLFTGQTSSYAMANCIGGAGIPEIGYTFTPLNWERDMVTFHTTAFAHELGHIFSAHHHYGNHVETGASLATLMIQGYTPGFRPAFSSVSLAAIRGWAETYLDDGAAFTVPPGMVDEAVVRMLAMHSVPLADWATTFDAAHGHEHLHGLHHGFLHADGHGHDAHAHDGHAHDAHDHAH